MSRLAAPQQGCWPRRSCSHWRWPAAATEPTDAGSPAVTAGQVSPSAAAGKDLKTIYLAGGCFWGLEKYVDQVQRRGRRRVRLRQRAPRTHVRRRQRLRRGREGRLRPGRRSTALPVDLYYDAIDPTTKNRQGNDMGTEYRTGIYYADPADWPVIELARPASVELTRPVAIEVAPVPNYAAAEGYHQKYLDKNPGGYCHIPSKLFDAAAAARPK